MTNLVFGRESAHCWKITLAAGLILLLANTVPSLAEEYPSCSCVEGNCTVLSNSSSSNSSISTLDVSPFKYCKDSTNIMCCTSGDLPTEYSGCEIKFGSTNTSSTDPLCQVLNNTCVNANASSDCNSRFLLNGTCLSRCPCGYEADSDNNCMLIMTTTTMSTTNATTTAANTSLSTATSASPESCLRLLFPIYDPENNCEPNLNFWLLVVIPPAVFLVLVVTVIIICCRKCRRTAPHGSNAPPSKDELEMKPVKNRKLGKGKGIKHGRTLSKPNDYTKKQSEQGQVVTPTADYVSVTLGQPGMLNSDKESEPGQEEYEEVGATSTYPTSSTVQPSVVQDPIYGNVNYENTEGANTASNGHEIYGNVNHCDDQELYINQSANSNFRAPDPQQQELYLPMDGKSSGNPTGHLSMSGKNDLDVTINKLQGLVANYTPNTRLRVESEEEYTYAQQREAPPDVSPEPKTYDDIPQGSDTDSQEELYENVRWHMPR